jgi:hypothetical protein
LSPKSFNNLSIVAKKGFCDVVKRYSIRDSSIAM